MVQYTVLSTRDHDSTVVVFACYGGEASGQRIQLLRVRSDTAFWQEPLTVEGEVARAIGGPAEDDCGNGVPAQSRRLSFPQLEWTVVAPESVAERADPLTFRPPRIVGVATTAVFHDGVGRYANYALRDGVWLPGPRCLVLVTTSEWRPEDIPYEDEIRTEGDGIVVLHVDRRPAR